MAGTGTLPDDDDRGSIFTGLPIINYKKKRKKII